VLSGKPLLCEKNTVSHNVFVDVGDHEVTSDDNSFAQNTYVTTREPVRFDLEAWQGRGLDLDTDELRALVELHSYGERLIWQGPAVEGKTAHEAVSADFFAKPWSGKSAGPLAVLGADVSVMLQPQLCS